MNIHSWTTRPTDRPMKARNANMEDKEMMEAFEAFEDDLNLTDAKYEVWLLGYDADDNITDYEFLIGSYDDPDDAVVKAQQVFLLEDLPSDIPEDVAYVELLVETVIDLDGVATNDVSLFSEHIIVKK